MPGVKTLTAMKPQLLEQRHQRRELLAGRPVRVVIVIPPADPDLVLPGLLNLRGAVAALPVLALGSEKQVGCAIHAQVGYGGIDQLMRISEAIRKTVKQTTAPPECLGMRQH